MKGPEGVFHGGEREAQGRAGVVGLEARVASFIRPFMPDQHREFFSQLPFVVVAARDVKQRPWVGILSNHVGFLRSPTPKELQISAALCPGDALTNALHSQAELGLLGLEYGTRRRNRLNVKVRLHHRGVITCDVVQSFGNCPKYIPQRVVERCPRHPSPAMRSANLNPSQRAMITKSDTFFIGSGYGGEGISGGMDASHRGGGPGFVRVLSGTRFMFPDYSGNQFFNTLGNLLRDPRAGFLFVDFESGTQLQLTGRVSIQWDAARVGENDDAALRWLTAEIDEVVQIDGALPLAFSSETAA